jgi:hypothetical protein
VSNENFAYFEENFEIELKSNLNDNFFWGVIENIVVCGISVAHLT